MAEKKRYRTTAEVLEDLFGLPSDVDNSEDELEAENDTELDECVQGEDDICLVPTDDDDEADKVSLTSSTVYG